MNEALWWITVFSVVGAWIAIYSWRELEVEARRLRREVQAYRRIDEIEREALKRMRAIRRR